jgi:hypothetical protein
MQVQLARILRYWSMYQCYQSHIIALVFALLHSSNQLYLYGYVIFIYSIVLLILLMSVLLNSFYQLFDCMVRQSTYACTYPINYLMFPNCVPFPFLILDLVYLYSNPQPVIRARTIGWCQSSLTSAISDFFYLVGGEKMNKRRLSSLN